MQLLGLNEAASGSLPASRFPERATAYFCDKCGEDITENFYVRRGHGGTPLGPATFNCDCGERYLSGAREWDDQLPGERRRSLRTLGIIALFAVPFAVSLSAAVLGIREQNKALTIAGAVMTVITAPFAVVLAPCFVEVRDIAASIYRTRIAKRVSG